MLTNEIKYSTLFKAFFIFLLFLLVSSMFLFNFTSPIATFILIIIIGLIIIFIISPFKKIKIFASVVLIGKTSILFILFENSSIYMFSDSYDYINNLNTLMRMNTYNFQEIVNVAGTLHIGFYYIYMLVYELFGNQLAIHMVNTLMIVLSGILFYDVFRERFSEKIAYITFILYNLSANMFLFGSLILKDPIVVFLMALSLYFYVIKKNVFLSIIVGILLVTVRIYSGFGIISAIIIDYILVTSISKKQRIISSLSLLIVSLISIGLPQIRGYFTRAIDFLLGASIVETIQIVPLTLFKFFFSPLPWNILDSGDIYRFLIIDSIIALLLIYGLILFIVKWFKLKDLRAKYYLFLVPIFFHAIALGIQYDGDSTRQRSGIVIFLILTLVLGLYYKAKNKKGAKFEKKYIE